MGGSLARVLGGVGLLIGLVMSASAFAADVDAQRLRLNTDAGRFLVAKDAALPPLGTMMAGAWLMHADRPLSVRFGDGVSRQLVSSLTTGVLAASVTPTRWLRLGIELPMVLQARGAVRSGVRPGDMRVGGKLALVDTEAGARWRVSALLDVDLPSGDGSRFLGMGRVGGRAGVAARVDAGVLAVAADVAGAVGSRGELGAVRLGPALQFGAGVSVAPLDALSVGVELDGGWWATASDDALALEALGVLRGEIKRGLVLTLGGGGGAIPGIAAPALRGLAGLAWAPGFGRETLDVEPPRMARCVVRAAQAGGGPVAGAQVRAEDTVLGHTSERGALLISAREGTLDLWVSAEGFLPQQTRCILVAGSEDDVLVLLQRAP